MRRQAAGVALVLAVAGCTGSAKPRSRAERIGSLGDTIGGTKAIGRIGDFLLENDQIRLVISDTGVKSDASETTLGRVNTPYGGSLVDADLRRVNADDAGGNDQLAELLPGFLFTVINPTAVCVPTRAGECPKPGDDAELRDGSDGAAAEVRVVGTGGDLLQMIALLNTGLLFPSNLEFSVVYRLHPGAKYVEIESTVKNTSTGAHPFPFLDPQELKDLGFAVPGVENLQFSVPLGMIPLFGGEQELFSPGFAGFNVKYAIESTYAINTGFPAFAGMVVDYLATRGRGVSYGLTVPKTADNFVNKFATGYPGQDITDFSILVPFTYAGVAAVYMVDAPSQLAAGEQYSYTSYFVVGRGDVASVADTIFELRGQATGTFGGRVVDEQTSAPVAQANVLVLDADDRPFDQIETDRDGAFLAKLPPGNYKFIVLKDDRLTTESQPLSIASNQQTGRLIQMKPPATLVVATLDELGRHAPAKIQLIRRFDGPTTPPADARTFLYDMRYGEGVRPTSFDGTNRLVEGSWWTKDGRLETRVRPGIYDLVVSRGPEYEVVTKSIDLRAGAFVAEHVALTRAFDTPGWISGDFHLHAQPSTDSKVRVADRVISCAAEGLEVAVATDHNYVTDYAPAIASSGLDPWLLGIPGMELTTFEMGHYNAYPLRIDAGSTRGGEFRWTNQPPQKLFDALRGLGTDATTIVQVNHPRQSLLGYFAQFFVDVDTGEPFTPTGIFGVFAPYGDEFKPENFSLDFEAIELLTGKISEDIHTFRAPDPLPPGPFPDPQPVPGEVVFGEDGHPQFPGTVETWFTMLDRGHTATGMGTSDSHGLLGDEPGYARTLLFVGAGKDTPGAYTRDDVMAAIHNHRTITTNAPFLEMTTGDNMTGDTVVGANHPITIRVRTPSWAAVDTLIVYSNSAVLRTIAIPPEQRDFEVVVDVAATKDSWVVAEVTGRGTMFPVVLPTEFPPLDATVVIKALSIGLDLATLPVTASLKPSRTHLTTPYAITNPIWIDIAGDGFDPPSTPFARKKPTARAALPDVRSRFEALPDVIP